MEKWSEIDETQFNKDNCKVLHLGEIKCTKINGLGSILARKDPGIAVDQRQFVRGSVYSAEISLEPCS